jgi:PAS domain S-box-containing protein
MSLKNRAMIIVVFMISVLLIISLYTIIKYNQKEIKNITWIYDSMIHKFYDISRSHLPAFYSSAMEELLAVGDLREAMAEEDKERLRKLTLLFYNSFGRRTSYLKEINYYSQKNKTILRSYHSQETGYKPVSINPMLTGVNQTRKGHNDFVIEQNGITYRLLKPIFYKNSHIGVLEFVVDPGHFSTSFEDLLNVKSAIIVEAGKLLKAAKNPQLEKIRDYYLFGRDAPFRDILKRMDMEKAHQEIAVNNRTYIVHNTIGLVNTRNETVANILAVQDITPIKKKINHSIFQIIIISIVGLAVIFIILYHSFGRLVGKIIERDTQLQTINEELEKEIIERKAIEDEIILHRDNLKKLVAEGTRKLELKSQQIEASETKFRTITSSVRDAIIMVDSDGNVSFWNKSAERIFGYTAEEAQGKELYNLIVPDNHISEDVEAFEIFRKTAEEKVVDVEGIIELEAKRKTGDVFPIALTAATVNIQGKLNTAAVIRDITRRKQEEKERRVLSSAVEQSSVVILITDTDGIIEYVNPKFTKVTGYTREEVLGKKPNILNSNIHEPEFYKELWDTIKAGRDWNGELFNRKKNGDLYWDSSFISPIKDSKGRITHFVAIKEDITERKQIENELREAKRSAEAASRSKSEFLANVSHELRTPMNAIIGMTELMLDTRITKEQREYLNIVQRSSNSLLSLLNDILDLSKIEAGRLMLEPLPFSLRGSLGDTAKTLSVQAHKKNLELVYYIDSEVPDRLIGDAGRLRQIIVNLIGNSIKFTKEGEIVLKIEVLEELPDTRVLLHFLISDTGIGIPGEKLDTIFDKFSQADASTTRRYGGSGLGLAISSRLVNLMEGIIWVDSPSSFPHFKKTGPGSTFHFTALFEIDKSTLDARRQVEVDVKKLEGLPLLIVDDNKTNRMFLQEVLSRYGLKPETANSGKDALRLLEEKSFQLLILDYQMPEMDGGTVLTKVRNELKSDIPVILLSSGIRSEELDHLIRMGISSHFFKPIDIRELLESIIIAMGYKGIVGEKIPLDMKKPKLKKEQKEINILVAEDNQINQRLIKKLLEKRGYTVDIAEDGKEAVEKFKQRLLQLENPYSLILMDIQMPIMDGIEATSEIRKVDKNIPIIALTAHAMKGDKRKFLSEGMNDYISKPVKKDFLFEILEKYVSK